MMLDLSPGCPLYPKKYHKYPQPKCCRCYYIFSARIQGYFLSRSITHVKASKQRTKTTVWLENNRECHLYTNIASNGKLASANTQKRYVHVFSEYQRRLCSSSTSILYLGRRRLQRKRPHDRAEGARRRLRRRHREEISILSKMLSFSNFQQTFEISSTPIWLYE